MKKGILFVLAGTSVLFSFFFFQKNHVEINIVGPVYASDGLGKVTVDLACILSKAYQVETKPTAIDKKDLPQEFQKTIANKIREIGPVFIYTSPLHSLSKKDYEKLEKAKAQKNTIKVAYSMFESSRLPEDWVKNLNDYFDIVVVPDPYLIDVFKNSGVVKPISVLPIPMNLEPYLKQPLKNHKNTLFTYSVLSTSIYRKNILGVLRAFVKVFKNRDDVKLRINSRYSYNGNNLEIARFIRSEGLTNVEYTTDVLSHEKYLEILKNTDCMLNVSFGEGFSLQPREAMAMGIPVIVTNNSAQKTICSTSLVRNVECPIQETAYHYFSMEPCGFFDICADDAIAEAMLDVYSNYDHFLNKSLKAREWVLQYDISQLQKEYIDFFNLENLKKIIKKN